MTFQEAWEILNVAILLCPRCAVPHRSGMSHNLEGEDPSLQTLLSHNDCKERFRSIIMGDVPAFLAIEDSPLHLYSIWSHHSIWSHDYALVWLDEVMEALKGQVE